MENQNTSITWEDIDIAVSLLLDIVKDKGYTAVYGIPRGGLIPAVILSHGLEIPLTMYLDKNQKVLVVDEMCDTGGELSKSKYNGFDTLSLFKRYNSKITPTYYHYEILNDNWLDFPWEE